MNTDKMTSEVVQVRMRKNTINQVDELQKSVDAPSRSDAVRRAIEISAVILTAAKHGNKILIEGKDGKQKQILITGLKVSNEK